MPRLLSSLLFFFNATATTEIYTLSLHDALPICGRPILWHIMKNYAARGFCHFVVALGYRSEFIKSYFMDYNQFASDRKSTRLNSSHVEISYAVFCLKKKTNVTNVQTIK